MMYLSGDTQMKPFQRRFYKHSSEFFADLKFLLQRRKQIKQAMSGEFVSPAFRERLMMVVTEVNACRYCRSFHVPQAANCGVSEEEIQQILTGQLPVDAPQEEIPGLAYAQHWAEENAQSNPEYREEIKTCYGEETFSMIEIILRMIRMGNLTGNTADYLLYRISFGLLGGGEGGTAKTGAAEDV